MSDETETARAEPQGDTVRVRYTLPVVVGGAHHDADTYETDVSPETAQELVEAGRAVILGDELKLTDEERAALPTLEPAEPDAEMVQGYADAPENDAEADPHAEHVQHS